MDKIAELIGPLPVGKRWGVVLCYVVEGAHGVHVEQGGLPLRCKSSGKQRSPVLHTNNNILYSSQREIKAVIRSHNKEHISIILSHETHQHTQS